MNNPTSQAGLRVRFGGDFNEVDIKILLTSLANVTKVFDEVGAELGEGQSFEIKVRALEKGSFVIDLGVVAAVTDLISSIDLDSASKVIA